MNTDKKLKRPDQNGTHRAQFEKNKAKILATREVCGICGRPVDKSLRWPHPLSPTVDHIIPINKGGHPSDLSNLQLAHWACNRKKSDKVYPLTCDGAIAKDVGLMDLLKLATSQDFSGMTVDLKVKVRLMFGISKTFKFNDIKVTDLLEPSVAAAYLDLIINETMI